MSLNLDGTPIVGICALGFKCHRVRSAPTFVAAKVQGHEIRTGSRDLGRWLHFQGRVQACLFPCRKSCECKRGSSSLCHYAILEYKVRGRGISLKLLQLRAMTVAEAGVHVELWLWLTFGCPCLMRPLQSAELQV